MALSVVVPPNVPLALATASAVGASTVMVSCAEVVLLSELVAKIVTTNVPAADGDQEIWPVAVFTASPLGRPVALNVSP